MAADHFFGSEECEYGQAQPHCGAKHIASPQTPYLDDVIGYDEDFRPYVAEPGENGEQPNDCQPAYRRSEGVFKHAQDIPWAVRWMKEFCGALKQEGYWGGHPGPFFRRPQFGWSFMGGESYNEEDDMPYGSKAYFRAKWAGEMGTLLPPSQPLVDGVLPRWTELYRCKDDKEVIYEEVSSIEACYKNIQDDPECDQRFMTYVTDKNQCWCSRKPVGVRPNAVPETSPCRLEKASGASLQWDFVGADPWLETELLYKNKECQPRSGNSNRYSSYFTKRPEDCAELWFFQDFANYNDEKEDRTNGKRPLPYFTIHTGVNGCIFYMNETDSEEVPPCEPKSQNYRETYTVKDTCTGDKARDDNNVCRCAPGYVGSPLRPGYESSEYDAGGCFELVIEDSEDSEDSDEGPGNLLEDSDEDNLLEDSDDGPGTVDCVDQYLDGDSCVDKCPSKRSQINDGQCVDGCPENKYIGNDKNCVESCPENLPYIDDDDNGKKKCVDKCPKKRSYMNNGQCVDGCPENKYVGKDKNCVESCPENLPYIDDDDNGKKKCVKKCPKERSYMNNGQCFDGCPENKYVGKDKNCVEDCPENLPYIDDDGNGKKKCVKKCPGKRRYLHEENCVSQCPLGLYIDKNQDDQGKLIQKCVVECPDDKEKQNGKKKDMCVCKYLSNGPDCVDQCPDGKFEKNGKCVNEKKL